MGLVQDYVWLKQVYPDLTFSDLVAHPEYVTLFNEAPPEEEMGPDPAQEQEDRVKRILADKGYSVKAIARKLKQDRGEI